jgi:hypothetical protein
MTSSNYSLKLPEAAFPGYATRYSKNKEGRDFYWGLFGVKRHDGGIRPNACQRDGF